MLPKQDQSRHAGHAQVNLGDVSWPDAFGLVAIYACWTMHLCGIQHQQVDTSTLEVTNNFIHNMY